MRSDKSIMRILDKGYLSFQCLQSTFLCWSSQCFVKIDTNYFILFDSSEFRLTLNNVISSIMFYQLIHTGWVKKALLKVMGHFLTLKMLPLAMVLIKTKKSPSFWPIGQKLTFFNGKLSPGIKNSKFSCKMSIFWLMGQKDGHTVHSF